MALGSLEALSCGAIPVLEERAGLVAATTNDLLASQAAKLEEILASHDESLLQFDSELGWIYAPNRRKGVYSSNSGGMRGPREYAGEAPNGILRVAAFGDSYVHGNEVADDEAWGHVLEGLDPEIEVLNFGVGGYGTDQALLRYRRHADAIAADVVILGFSSTNYARNLGRYRPYLSPRGLPLFKPRFRLAADGELVLVPAPVRGVEAVRRATRDLRRVVVAAGDGDFFFSPLIWQNPLYDRSGLIRLATAAGVRVWNSKLRSDRLWVSGVMNPRCEGFPLLEAIIRQAHAEATGRGSRFLLLVYPGRTSNVWSDAPAPYRPLLDALADLPVEDLAPTVREVFAADPEALFAPGGHYSAAGNAAVARRVHAILREGAALSESRAGR